MVLPKVTRQIHLVARPEGEPKESDFSLVEVPLPSELTPGELLIRHKFVSVDPYMRPQMFERNSFTITGYPLNEKVPGCDVGIVVLSNDPAFREGDIVLDWSGWTEYAVVKSKCVQKVSTEALRLPWETSLGAMGLPGATAYFGLLEIGKPKAGETLVISAAAGAVGSMVGQIGKLMGLTVIGIAGSNEKCKMLVGKFGFDACVNYKSPMFRDYLSQVCPRGIDIYFENVGGDVSAAVYPLLNKYSRVCLCGQISQYNLPEEKLPPGPNLAMFIVKEVRMEGFLVSRFLDRWPEAFHQIAQWIFEGKIAHQETVIDGIENIPTAFISMMNGTNFGKQVVQIY